MIYLGLDDLKKHQLVAAYCAKYEIRKVYVLSPARFAPTFAAEHMTDPTAQGDGRSGLYIDWPDIILYRYFYKLMQEVDRHTLVVVNECLRTQNRHSLTYNCIRNFLNQAGHRLIFQYLPIIESEEDFMTLFDFDTRSQWKREHFKVELLKEAGVACESVPVQVQPIHVPVNAKTLAAYAREKAALLAEVRSDPEKDPHLIPRNLLLVSGKAKLGAVDPTRRYVGRNNRFKLPNVETYKDVSGEGPRVVFDLPHNFLDFTDLLTVSRQHTVEVLVANTKADAWYLARYQEWAERVRHAQTVLCQ
jgi:hypothetical protein